MVRKDLKGGNKGTSIKGGYFCQTPIAVNSITCMLNIKHLQSALLDRGQMTQRFAKLSSEWSFSGVCLSFSKVFLGLVTPRLCRDRMKTRFSFMLVQKWPRLFSVVIMDSLETPKIDSSNAFVKRKLIWVWFGFWFWSQTLQTLHCTCSCWALQFSLWCVSWVWFLRRPISKGDGS